MTKILDIKQSVSAASGNASLAKELFSMLIDDLDKRLQQIESSFQANNMESLGEHIHKLYGATAYCIVPKLRESTKSLNEILREKDYDNINGLVSNVINEIHSLINEAPGYIKMNWEDFK